MPRMSLQAKRLQLLTLVALKRRRAALAAKARGTPAAASPREAQPEAVQQPEGPVRPKS